LRLRFSQSLASLRQRLSQAKVRSTTQKARVHLASRRRGGVAARGARSTAGDAGDRMLDHRLCRFCRKKPIDRA
jgi:hypothetical protein